MFELLPVFLGPFLSNITNTLLSGVVKSPRAMGSNKDIKAKDVEIVAIEKSVVETMDKLKMEQKLRVAICQFFSANPLFIRLLQSLF